MNFNLFGFPVKVPISAWVGVGVIAYIWSGAFSGGGVWVPIVFAVLLFLSILFHEFGHAFVANFFGWKVFNITLWILGGYTLSVPIELKNYKNKSLEEITDDEMEVLHLAALNSPHYPYRQAFVSLAGPIFSFLAAGIAFALTFVFPQGSLIREIFDALIYANILLGIFNLIPAGPLDGGRILSSLIWGYTGNRAKGIFVSGITGKIFAVLVLLFGLYLGQTLGFLFAIIIGLTAGFIWSGSPLKEKE
jgi:Zn-dependent protease